MLKSGWFPLSRGLNQFHFTNQEAGTLFLRALQTLHPPYSCAKTIPFSDLPEFETRGSYTKNITPSKRTIALGVFEANADIVGELGELDQNLYETDRIEIGRRLDYSRWINFVELSSSTRWKDVKAEFKQLVEFLPQAKKHIAGEAQEFINSLKGSERIKGSIAQKLLYFLRHLERDCNNLDLYHETLGQIQRAEHFQTARLKVFRRLPLLFYFNSQGSISSPVAQQLSSNLQLQHSELYQYRAKMELEIVATPKSSVLRSVQSGVELAIATSKAVSRMDPIFLFDTPEVNVPEPDHNLLKEYLTSIAQHYQCLYLCRNRDFFSAAQANKSYLDEDLIHLLSSPQRTDRRTRRTSV